MKKLLVICGATASGKTALAVECAKRLGGEVVSCDALLVYRGLNIGTAKPTKEERAGIPHHLIDVADPTDSFTVHDYESLALAAIEDIALHCCEKHVAGRGIHGTGDSECNRKNINCSLSLQWFHRNLLDCFNETVESRFDFLFITEGFFE